MLGKLRSLSTRFRYDDREMPFLEHLEEFRKMIVRSVIALLIGMAICFPFADSLVMVLRAPAEPYIVQSAEDYVANVPLQVRLPVSVQEDGLLVLRRPAETNMLVGAEGELFYPLQLTVTPHEQDAPRSGSIRLQFSEPAGAIKMWLMVTFFGGLLLSLPVLIFIIGSFVMPGVKDAERKVLARISGFAGVLFVVGIFMGYKVTLPLALGIMLDVGGMLGGESIWFYGKYISFGIQLLIGFGLAFQLPVVILVLGKLGLVNSTQLREKRPHVVVGLFILAMFLTPPDVMTQVLMAAPLILLYEFCIWFLYLSGNRGETVEERVLSEVSDDDENATKETK